MKFKSLVLLLIMCCFACKQETTILKSDVLLKEVTTTLFTNGTNTAVQFEDHIINYENTFNRLPNTEFSMFYLKKHPETYMPYFNIRLNLNDKKEISIDGTQFSHEEMVSEIRAYIDFSAMGKPTMLHLNFDEDLTFEDFYTFFTTLKPILQKDILLNKNLFIYDLELLPDCDCSL